MTHKHKFRSMRVAEIKQGDAVKHNDKVWLVDETSELPNGTLFHTLHSWEPDPETGGTIVDSVISKPDDLVEVCPQLANY